ncbi:hypothetical protein ElyMa_003310200 [Elysia marginata]|uniref:Uncharacterized protein n=1 Tax=Elysia marginata TaxID=1093978 RepID=A0AAV4JEJ4_9GAST|nr:hypothetical protein ElyMa_003310200 [Elysia marginata]
MYGIRPTVTVMFFPCRTVHILMEARDVRVRHVWNQADGDVFPCRTVHILMEARDLRVLHACVQVAGDEHKTVWALGELLAHCLSQAIVSLCALWET